jgi:hypothetical protein
MRLLGTGKVECIPNGPVVVHWWPVHAKVGDPCLCGQKTKTDKAAVDEDDRG